MAASLDRPGRRILRNAGLLLGSGSVAGALGLAATALAARALGPADLGALALLHALALTGSAIARFNGWRAILRYGPACLAEGRLAELHGLVRLVTLLDLAAGLVVLALLQAALPWLGPTVGLGPGAQEVARWYLLLVLVGHSGTPVGVLRLLDRFDLVALLRPAAALVRLAGAAAAWAQGGGLGALAAAWLLAALVEGGALWLAAGRVMAGAGILAVPAARLGTLGRAHPGLGRLLWASNLAGSAGLLAGRLATLLVGALLGPAAAGLYQVAQQLAGTLERPLDMLRRSVEPELARLAADGQGARLDRLARRLGRLVPLALLPLPLAAWLAGGPALELLLGPGFANAAPVLVLLLVRQVLLAAALSAGAVILVAGTPGALVLWQLAGRLAHLALLLPLAPLAGLAGAGLAAVLGGAVEAALGLRLAAGARPPGPPGVDPP